MAVDDAYVFPGFESQDFIQALHTYTTCGSGE